MIHKPVLQKEVLEYLDPNPDENFVDATIDGGGHATLVLKKIKPNGKVLGIDWDPEIYQKLKSEKLDRLILVNDSYTSLTRIVKEYKFEPVSGILFDLGMSSWHLEKSGRGFSFLKDEPLDMRYHGMRYELTAGGIVNKWSELKIKEILKEYGEERFARKIADKIVKERKKRPIKTTFHLVEVIKKAVPGRYRKGRIHFATRTFQALRIAVNDELDNFKKALPQALEVLAPGGRIVVISFHSLEDRIVKRFFKRGAEKDLLKILTQKPVIASQEEIKINSRCRSAKLRAAMKV